jgi:salicylate hydroxylase
VPSNAVSLVYLLLLLLLLTTYSPYVAQGAAQAVEDAGALGAILSSLSARDEIPQALQVYESSRKQHAEQIQQSGGHNRVVLHLPDGPDQESRDELFQQAMHGGSTPDRWTDHNTQTSVWGHDAEEAVLKAWDGMYLSIGISTDCSTAN